MQLSFRILKLKGQQLLINLLRIVVYVLIKFNYKEYAKRYIYFVIDGQNVLNTDKFLFCYLEVNDRLNGLISQKIWDSKPAERMDFY